MYYNNVLELIGNTPLLSLQESTGCNIFAKAEFLNPGGSIKDQLSIDACDEAGIAMIFVGDRHFRH